MGKQMLFASPELTRELSAGACLVGSLLCIMSKDGTQDVTCSENFIAEKLGLNTRTVTRVKKALLDNGYIEFISLEKKELRWVARYRVTPKLVSAFELPDTSDKMSVDRQNVYGRQNVGAQTNCHDTTDKMSVCPPTKCPTTTDKMSEEKNNKRIVKEKGKETHTAPHFENVPLPTDDDYICDEVRDEMPQTFELTPLETKPATTEQVKEKSSAKREKNKNCTYPTSVEEVLELFKQWRDKHVKLEPRIQGVNLELEAEKFFEYWEDNNWSRKGKKMKSVNGSIATWLGNCCDKVRGNFKPALTSEQLERLNAIGEKYNPDKSKPVEAEFEIVDEVKIPNLEEILHPPVADTSVYEEILRKTFYN